TSGSYTEYCSLPESGSSLTPGTYWILVQNWSGSGAATDSFTLNWTMIEEDGGSGPIQVNAPTSVTAGVPYALDLSWDLPNLQAGDIKTEVISLFCNGMALNEVKVTLNRIDDDVVKEAQVSDIVEPGDTVPYIITINPDPIALTYNGGSAAYRLTDTLPIGMSYVPGSASIEPTHINDNQLVWVIPVQEDRQYVMTTNMDDALCDTGFGGYVDLAGYGLMPRSSLSGDAIVRHVDEYYGGSDPFAFFGTNYDSLYFTDNGYLVPADAAPTNSGANVAIPNAAAPNNFAAGLWRDFIVTYDAANRYGITIAGASGGSLMVIEYDNISPTGNTATDSLDMNIVFSRQPSDGVGEYEVVFAYDNVALATPQTGTIGLENADGTDGVQYAFNDLTAGELEDLIICYDWTNQVKITYEAEVDADLTTSQKLTNALQHFVNGGGEGETEAEIAVSAVLLDIEAEGQTEVPVGPLTYTLTIENDGVGAAAGATAAADLPAGTTHRSGGSYNPLTGVVTWTLPTIASAGSADVQLVVSPTLATLPKPDDPVFPAASAAGGFVPQIIGGGAAKITDWPWQVALLDTAALPNTYNAQFCGGALIAPDWVLTAAHCAVDYTPEDITVLAGAAVLTDSQATLMDVAQIIVHEQYDPAIVESDYDLALLRLSEPLPLSDSIDTIRVATPADAAMYTPDLFAVATGWGKISTNPDTYTAQLQRVTLQLQSNATCSAYLTDHFGAEIPITDHMICAGFPEGGKSSCSGDSGGALVVPDGEGNWLIAGVTSWGATACDAPSSIYTRASQFVEWIERAMNRYTFETCVVTTGTGLAGGADTCSQPIVTEATFPKKLQQETVWSATKTVRTFTHTNGLTATVTVPAEAVPAETIQLVYSPLDAPTHALFNAQAVSDTFTLAGHAFYLVATQEGAPLTDYAFSQPVTLTVGYGDSVLNEDSLGLYRWNGTEWTQEGITPVSLNKATNRLTVTLSNPGEFTLLQEGVFKTYLPALFRED
ncbi:MAG: serine protease, partial [Anaerolineae bacterium]|nr:serine protease [Anaerolineae bacterium]